MTRLSVLERHVVLIAIGDAAQMRPSRWRTVRRWIGRMGERDATPSTAGPRPLANPRLETLRASVAHLVSGRCEGTPVVLDLQRIGFDTQLIAELLEESGQTSAAAALRKPCLGDAPPHTHPAPLELAA